MTKVFLSTLFVGLLLTQLVCIELVAAELNSQLQQQPRAAQGVRIEESQPVRLAPRCFVDISVLHAKSSKTGAEQLEGLYFVGTEGDIKLAQLGRVEVAGMSLRELEHALKQRDPARRSFQVTMSASTPVDLDALDFSTDKLSTTKIASRSKAPPINKSNRRVKVNVRLLIDSHQKLNSKYDMLGFASREDAARTIRVLDSKGLIESVASATIVAHSGSETTLKVPTASEQTGNGIALKFVPSVIENSKVLVEVDATSSSKRTSATSSKPSGFCTTVMFEGDKTVILEAHRLAVGTTKSSKGGALYLAITPEIVR